MSLIKVSHRFNRLLDTIFKKYFITKVKPSVVKIQRWWRKARFGRQCREARLDALSCVFDEYRTFYRKGEFVKAFLPRLFEKTIYNSRDQLILLQQGQFFNGKERYFDCSLDNYLSNESCSVCGIGDTCEHGSHTCLLCTTERLPCKLEMNMYYGKITSICYSKKYCSKCVKKSKNFRAEVFRLSMIGC